MKEINVLVCEKCGYPNSEFSDKCLECAKKLDESPIKTVKTE